MVNLSSTVLPPIPTTGLTADDVDELTNYTRDVMMKALVSLTDSSYGHLSYKPVAPELSSPTQARAQAIKAVQGIVVEGDLRKRLAAKKPKENGLAN